MVYDYLIELDLSKTYSQVALENLIIHFRGNYVDKFKFVEFNRRFVRLLLHSPVALTIPALSSILGVPCSCISLCRDIFSAIKFLNFKKEF